LRQSDLPEYVNWYEAGKVSESIDQTGCGACWAFTTATTLESLNAIRNNLHKVPVYSVQYLMDCDDVDWGCDGGWMLDAYEFTRQNGIVAWKDYDRSYTARKNACL
jgi:C1A family cysteine protease